MDESEREAGTQRVLIRVRLKGMMDGLLRAGERDRQAFMRWVIRKEGCETKTGQLLAPVTGPGAFIYFLV